MFKGKYGWIDVNELPKRNRGHDVCVDWKNSIGCKCRFEYKDVKGILEIVDYVKSGRISVRYENNILDMEIVHFKRVHIGNITKCRTSSFKMELNDVIKDEKRDLIIIDRKYKKSKRGQKCKYYKYHCNKCGHEGWAVESGLFSQGKGCACCSSRIVVKGINDMATTTPWMIKYLVNEEDACKYTGRSSKKILMKCPDCGNHKELQPVELYMRGFSCHKCGDGFSYPEKFMCNVLDQLNIDFETQYSPLWCGLARYDFYIPKKNLIIEVHGEQHYIKQGKSSKFKTLKEQQIIDRNKEMFAKENGIKNYIQLDCRESNLEFIKNSILNSELVKFFKFNSVNWLECATFSTSNLVKSVCDYYMENKKMLIKDMADVFNLKSSTVSNYLKKGAALGWCDFKHRSTWRYTGTFNKKVECIELHEVFESVTDCAKQLEIRFNKNFNASSISAVCRGRRNTHKGFTFKYIV